MMLDLILLFNLFSTFLLFRFILVVFARNTVFLLLFFVLSFIVSAFLLFLLNNNFLAFVFIINDVILLLFVIMMLASKLSNLSRNQLNPGVIAFGIIVFFNVRFNFVIWFVFLLF